MTQAVELHHVQRRPLSELLDLYSRCSTAMLAVAFLLYLIEHAGRCRLSFACYDTMEISGRAAFLIGVMLSLGMRGRFQRLINGLIETGAIVPRGSQAVFEAAFRRTVGRASLLSIVVLSSAVLACYLSIGFTLLEALLSVWAASVAGERFGRLMSYAFAASLVTRSGGDFSINFWHPDKAGGLLPFSRFYLYCGLLASIPAIWLAFWWVIIPHVPVFVWYYSVWREPFVALWAISVGLFALSFVFPVWLIHRQMAHARSRFLARLGWVPSALADLDREIERASDEARALPVYARIDNIQKLHATASGVTTWPLDRAVMSRFTGVSVAHLASPFALKLLIGGSIDWKSVFDAVIGK